MLGFVSHRAASFAHHCKDRQGRSQPDHPQHSPAVTSHILASPVQLFDPRSIRKHEYLYHLPHLASGHLHSTSTPFWLSLGTRLLIPHLLLRQDQGKPQQVSILIPSAPNTAFPSQLPLKSSLPALKLSGDQESRHDCWSAATKQSRGLPSLVFVKNQFASVSTGLSLCIHKTLKQIQKHLLGGGFPN